MSRPALVGLVLLIIIVQFCGIWVGHHLGLSQFASVGIGLLPALLLAFSLMRRWFGPGVHFLQWVVVVLLIGVFAVLANLLMNWIGAG